MKPPPRRLPLPARRTRAGGQQPQALLSWQPKRADLVWTRKEWTALCEHLHNDNSRFHFVQGFRKPDGSKKYARSQTIPVERAISWAWASINDPAKERKLAFVPYSANGSRSRWGGMDFDAHSGECDRARKLAFAAFRLLLNVDNGLAIILETSGTGGWHVWAIAPDFRDTRDWILLMKGIVAQIGTVVRSGVCEIFPPDADREKFSRGMRVPGSWNPSNDSFSEIYYDETQKKLPAVLSRNSSQPGVVSRNSKSAALVSKDLREQFPDKEKNFSFFFFLSSIGLDGQEFSLVKASTRNEKLSTLVGTLFYLAGRTTARRVAELQFDEAEVSVRATKAEHLESFDALWSGLASPWEASLSCAEKKVFDQLATDHERDAFRIVRNFARKAKQDGRTDFPIVRDNLALRIGVTGKGAGKIRDKFVKLGIIAKTANFVPNKLAARFRWLLRAGPPPRKGSL